MLARFLNNWPYKLLALALAILLRVYVGSATNPQTTKQMTIPVAVTGTPGGLVPTQYTQNVSVTFSGPPNKIESLLLSDVQATVNLSQARPGPNAALPIKITLAPALRDDIQFDNLMPSGAAVYLDTRTSVRMTVTPEFSRSAPVGYEYQPPTVSPTVATINGPASLVNNVSRLVVFADPGDTTAAPTTIDDTGPIVALDNREKQIDGLDISPSQGHLIIPIRKVGALKSLVISAQIVGAPRYPFRIDQVDVQPTMAVVSGPAPLLAATSVALTEPIDVTAASDTFHKVVKLQLPPGLTAIQNPLIDVTIHFTASSPEAGQARGGLVSHILRDGAVQ